MRIAWFSPLPPQTSGIAAYSAELLPLLAARGHTIATFTAANARDFVWQQRREPVDLTVYQLGNDACHDYMWAYMFRYPGLVVLHDAQLHQARALWLTKRWQPRRDDYLAELRANHPDAPADLGELVAAGLGGSLYHHWPMIRLVVESARLTVAHNCRVVEELRERYPNGQFEFFGMGVGEVRSAQCAVRTAECRVPSAECGVPSDAIVVAAFGGITPEKRIGPLIRVLSAMSERHSSLHLLLVGNATAHYDVLADARKWGVADRVHLTGYVTDAMLASYMSRADICACLRWPSNRETSASWLRCLGAGRATIITDLAHLADVPTLDPRGWRVLDAAARDADARNPIAVSIDILDEEHSLQLALERLATDAALRRTLGESARAWWTQHHQLDTMAASYERVIARAAATPPPKVVLPRHLRNDGSEHSRMIAAHLGVTDRLDVIWRD